MNAKKAVEFGFADEVLFEAREPESDGEEDTTITAPEAKMYSSRIMDQAILNRLGIPEPKAREEPVLGMDGKTEDGAVPYQILMKQLDFLR